MLRPAAAAGRAMAPTAVRGHHPRRPPLVITRTRVSVTGVSGWGLGASGRELGRIMMVKRLFVATAVAVVLMAAPAAAQQYPPAVNSLTVSDTTPTPGQTITAQGRT